MDLLFPVPLPCQKSVLASDDNHRGPGSAERQAEALRLEGVDVTSDSMGEMYVDFSRYGWFPKHLPSEESDQP